MTPTTAIDGPRPVAAPHHARGRRVLRLILAGAVVLGTLLGVIATSLVALLLATPRLLWRGLAPMPEGALLRWLTAPEIARPATTSLLWLLALTTLVLSAALATEARWLWRAYAAWACTGGVLAAYALVANLELAPETGIVALLIGGVWSAVVAFAIARTQPVAPGRDAPLGRPPA